MKTRHEGNGSAPVIRIEGLVATTRILHVTDSHVSAGTETRPGLRNCAARMHNAYARVRRAGTGEETTTPALFREAMDDAAAEKPDLLALTGDIINYPSEASVEFIRSELERSGMEWVYTAGNHDWHFEGLPGSSEDLRREWRARRLAPLYTGGFSYESRMVGELNVVAIDNSTYQIDNEQLAFFRAQDLRGLPLVLLVHIPISLPSIREEKDWGPLCGDPRWGAEADGLWEIERRERWPESGNLPSTTEFVEAVRACGCLVAILCGHTHSPSVDRVNEGAMQYIGEPACAGAWRTFEFRPLA